MELNDCLRAYREKCGKEPSPAAVRCVEWLIEAGKRFSAIGFRDGSNAQEPLADTMFDDFARNSFPDDAEMAAICADYVRGCYHDGLAEGKVLA